MLSATLSDEYSKGTVTSNDSIISPMATNEVVRFKFLTTSSNMGYDFKTSTSFSRFILECENKSSADGSSNELSFLSNTFILAVEV